MLQIRQSNSSTINKNFNADASPPSAIAMAAARTAGERCGTGHVAVSGSGNVDWLRNQWRKTGRREAVAVILIGGVKASHLRLRQAQSHLRHDFTPSHWSHCLLAWGAGLSQAVEAPLIAEALPWPLESNGLCDVKLKAYDDSEAFPNCALLAIPAKPKEVAASVKNLRNEGRVGTLDVVALTHAWLGFLWGVGRAANPLVEGLGIPSAAAIEMILESAEFEITPNVVSQSSSPEAIWQSARWWQDWHQREGKKEGISGGYRIGHSLSH